VFKLTKAVKQANVNILANKTHPNSMIRMNISKTVPRPPEGSSLPKEDNMLEL